MLTPFGRLVRKHRIDKDMTLGDMAENLGVASSFLSSIETGKKSIPQNSDLVERVAVMLGLSGPAKEELHIAALASQKVIQFEMPQDERRRAAIAAFARMLPDLSNETLINLTGGEEEK